ncbi:unnamed protein product, partial [Meganyctiphanes norvegica]
MTESDKLLFDLKNDAKIIWSCFDPFSPRFPHDVPTHVGCFTEVSSSTRRPPRLGLWNIDARCHEMKHHKRVKRETEILVANDIGNIEAVRFQLKTPHDENIVTHFEAQETMFDYAFSHIGIDTPKIDHPIVLTEAFLNPNYSRQLMSELLFECYGVPSISYCVDGLLSFHYNNLTQKDGLVINMGNCTTHVMPVLDGIADAANTRRIRMGGQHLSRFLWRWLQLRFPQHLNAITISRAEEILHNHMYIAKDYMTEISKWSSIDYYEKYVKKIQLPFVAAPVSTVSVEQQRERRKEAARRLVELNARKREEKLQEDESELSRLIELEEAMEEFTPDEAEYQHALEEAEVSSPNELNKKIAVLQQRIEKTRAKMAAAIAQASQTQAEEEEPKSKRVCEEMTPQMKADLEKKVLESKHKWREIHARRAARRQKRHNMLK